MIVSEIAGTTRDAIDLPMTFEGQPIDARRHRRTAPAAKVGESLEYYTVAALPPGGRARRRGARRLRRDRGRHRAGLARRRDGDADRLCDGARAEQVGSRRRGGWRASAPTTSTTSGSASTAKLRLRPRVLTASAQTGRHVERMLVEAVGLADRSRDADPDPQLNRFIADVVAARQPPRGQARHQPAPEDAVHEPDGRTAAALLDPGQLPRARHPRLRLLSGKPACASATGWRGSR